MRYTTGAKYHNKKTTYGGVTFDSKKEAKRFAELKMLEMCGEISDLQRQVKYVLIPRQMDGKRVAEREVDYYADFVYKEAGKTVVEDVKGFRDDVYKLKRKLMLYVHGIRIRET